MGKKTQQQENKVVVEGDTNFSSTSSADATFDSDPSASQAHEPGRLNPDPGPQELEGSEGDPLMEEVQSFLNHRFELAQKLTKEIAATERKLVQLKRSLAVLVPKSQGDPKLRTVSKKSKSKPTVRSVAEGE